ncbi:MAG: peptidoglycan-binding protein, partial [Flavobacteriaceae bacterium]|nr:peptidoglycan-binding protein [Flavobacteriaceae bacterium]
NWVIIATKNSVIASNALNSLISFPEPEEPEEDEEQEEKINYNVKVFAFEKANTFDKVDNNKLAQLGFVLVTDTYADEDSTGSQIFSKQYKAKNKALPSYYATRGFDVMYDLVMRLASGNDLYETYQDGVSYRLESKFDYQKILFGITENKGLFLLEYNPDLSLIRHQ